MESDQTLRAVGNRSGGYLWGLGEDTGGGTVGFCILVWVLIPCVFLLLEKMHWLNHSLAVRALLCYMF